MGDVVLTHAQAQDVHFQLVEIQHLVDQPEHRIGAGRDGEQFLVRVSRDGLILEQRGKRSGDDGQRVAEFVGDVGEETHVHLVGPVLQLVLLFCDAQAQFVRLQADDETDQLVHCEQGG